LAIDVRGRGQPESFPRPDDGFSAVPGATPGVPLSMRSNAVCLKHCRLRVNHLCAASCAVRPGAPGVVRFRSADLRIPF